MALEWGKEISFSGLKKRASKPKAVYPEKTYMNLAIADKREVDMRRSLPLAIILVIVVALVIKFGIFDFYARVGAKEAALAVEQQTLNTLTAQLTNYDAVLAEYEGYESIGLSGDDLTVGALDAMALVDQYVRPVANVSSVALSGNTMTLNLTGISLDGVGKLSSTLYGQDIVSNVTVSTAATQQSSSDAVATTMTVTLKPAVDSTN